MKHSCGGETQVIDTRTNKDGSVYRRRECLSCKRRFTSTERANDDQLLATRDLRLARDKLAEALSLLESTL